MTKTVKSNTNTRKGPSESATAFSVGTVKMGNDGNMWITINAANSSKEIQAQQKRIKWLRIKRLKRALLYM